MGEWKKVRLKDVLIEGSKERVDDTSKYQKLTIKLNFKGMEKSKVREKMADRRPFYIREKGEIVIGKQNYFNGSIAILPDELDGGICSNAIMSFKTKKEYNNKYIYYLLSDTSFINRRSYLANGTGQKELSEKDFLNFEVIIPNINEQEKIVHILENVDLIIKNYEKLLEEKNRFIKSQFVEMFGNLKERVKINDCCSKVTDYVASGSFASLHENVTTYDTENFAIMVKTADFANGFTKGLTYTDEKGYNFLHNSNLFGGELLLSNIGASIGKVHRVPKLEKKMTLAPNAIMLKTNELYIEDYLQYYFLSDEGQKVLKSMETATAMPKFNKTQLKDVTVPKADLKEQLKFSKILQLIDKQKFELEKIIDNYKKLKKGLMQQLLTGKIRVKI